MFMTEHRRQLTVAPSERDTYAVFCKGADLLKPLANGFCFGEGPRWFEGLLWFSDMLGEALHTVTLQGAMTTLPLAGHTPSGLGFRPDGSLLIASTENRQVLRYDGETVACVADLSGTVPANLGDLRTEKPTAVSVVFQLGRSFERRCVRCFATILFDLGDGLLQFLLLRRLGQDRLIGAAQHDQCDERHDELELALHDGLTLPGYLPGLRGRWF